jgi:hypothetical protein
MRGLALRSMLEDALYAFDAADAALTLLPMAARRALDVAGVHVSLRGWQRLPLPQRQRLVALGALESVPVEDVLECVHDSFDEQRRQAPLREPAASEPPPEQLLQLLGPARPLTEQAYRELRALDRYVLLQLAGRGKHERLLAAYDEILL